MSLTPNPVPLAADLNLVVQWSARIADFIALWEQHLAQAASGKDHLLEAAITVLGDVEQRQDKTEAALTDVYRVSGLLPATGDEVLVGALVLRVDQRRFSTRSIAGVPLVTVVFQIGIERYQYETVKSCLLT